MTSRYTRKLFLGLFLLIATGCTPRPHSAADTTVESLVKNQNKINKELDDLEVRARNLWDHCSYRAAYDTTAREDCSAVWHENDSKP